MANHLGKIKRKFARSRRAWHLGSRCPFISEGRADAQLFQFFHQAPDLVHLPENVRAPHELAVEVYLQDGRPVGVVFNASPELGVIQHVVG